MEPTTNGINSAKQTQQDEFSQPPCQVVYQNNEENSNDHQDSKWFVEELDVDLKLSFALNSVLHRGITNYQDIALLDTKHFGKVLVIDGKMQSAEKDEFIYHELMVHPALLLHDYPKTVFVMGGGEGSTAREVLRHDSVERLVMCDIDQDVVDFCRTHLTENQEAFRDKRLHLIINDAKTELENTKEKFDIIIGDLADPLDGGPCNLLYTKSFYAQVIKRRLNNSGIFMTQAGLSGILTHKQVFTSIYNTLKHVFKHVIALSAHVPSYSDETGWVMASDKPLVIDAEQIDNKIKENIKGELRYLDGLTMQACTIMNKTVRESLMNETHVLTEEDVKFLHGQGVANSHSA